jgi:hypothetical protein
MASEANESTLKNKSEISPFDTNPILSMWGGIHYGMDKSQMEQVVKQKFQQLEANGKIITSEQFSKIKDKYYRPLTDLTRIWGADYLQKMFASEKLQDRYAVPNYVIVKDNDYPIVIEVYLNDFWPIVNNITNAKIYFETIKGKPLYQRIGQEAMDNIGPKTNVKFADFSSNGNIYESSDGKLYVLDTEFKSFEIINGVPYRLRELVRESYNTFHQSLSLSQNNKFFVTI